MTERRPKAYSVSGNPVGNSIHSKKIIFSSVNQNFRAGEELAVGTLGVKLHVDMLVTK
jgi:hypothetical protein